MRKVFIFLFFVLISAMRGQRTDTSLAFFRSVEHELKELQKAVFFSRDDKEKLEANREFLATWEKAVSRPYALRYAFDSLREVSRLASENGNMKIITWNIPRSDGSHVYFGYLLVQNKKRIRKGFLRHETIESYDVHRLQDRSATIKSPESYIGSPDKWFGMLYTKIIACDGYYTLLGWDGNDKLTQRKFIDVLYFRGDGSPVFGKDVFRIPRKNPKRVMFEWSTDVSMSLRYNERDNQIVFSHLASRQHGSVLDGQFQFYGPDGSFDAFEMKADKWVLVEDIDARNEKSKNDNAEKPDPKKQTPVYRPRQ